MIDWLKRAWRYSRTLFINVATILLSVLTVAVGTAAGMDLSSFPWWVTIAVSVTNALLRLDTHGPVGSKDD